MRLSPKVQDRFDRWINQDTWDSAHWCDMERFYEFVHVHTRFSRKVVQPGHIKELILQRWANHYQEEGYLEEMAEHYAALFQELCAFWEVRSKIDFYEYGRQGISNP